jgi:hypothetical protein
MYFDHALALCKATSTPASSRDKTPSISGGERCLTEIEKSYRDHENITNHFSIHAINLSMVIKIIFVGSFLYLYIYDPLINNAT